MEEGREVDKLKRKLSVHTWPDFSGGGLSFDLIGKKKMLRAEASFPELEFDVVDRHTKAGILEKYKCSCDTFQYCSLSLADNTTLRHRKLKDIGLQGVFKILEDIWEKEKPVREKSSSDRSGHDPCPAGEHDITWS